ncbi:MAG: hypothetical protein RL017_394 [Pseudomonadota bacterium]|jgi:hypothetical protein
MKTNNSKKQLLSLVCGLFLMSSAFAGNIAVNSDGVNNPGTNSNTTINATIQSSIAWFNHINVICYPSNVNFRFDAPSSTGTCNATDTAVYFTNNLGTASLNQLKVIGTTNVGQKVEYDTNEFEDGYSVAAVKINQSSSVNNINVSMFVDPSDGQFYFLIN